MLSASVNSFSQFILCGLVPSITSCHLPFIPPAIFIDIMGKKKSKKPPVPVNLKPEFVLDPKTQPPQKKKKKNAPDRPQPEWMFPPDKDNPVLNPKLKSEERLKKEKEDHDLAIKFLKHRAVGAPMKAAPPSLLLTLVGAFLSSYGFDGASRIYTTQLKSRKRLDDWEVEFEVPIPKEIPDLVKIYKAWYKSYLEKRDEDETSSDDFDDSEDTRPKKKARKTSRGGAAGNSSKDESENDSGASDSDDEMADTTPGSTPATKSSTIKKAKSSSSSTSSSNSSSDSDADDEKEDAGAKLLTSATSQGAPRKGHAQKSKSSSASSGTSSSDSESGSDPDGVLSNDAKSTSDDIDLPSTNKTDIAPKQSTTSPKPTKPADSSSGSSSSDTDSESDSSDALPRTKSVATVTKKSFITPATSDSSETLQATSAQKSSPVKANLAAPSTSTSSSSDSDSNSEPAPPPPNSTILAKRKRSDSPEASKSSKKQQHHKDRTPFQRVPKDTLVDPKLASNAYQSYDYADRAHQDLSVTKGKGFTKEKNKKKRGSYRGGMIDTAGGKGIKFDD